MQKEILVIEDNPGDVRLIREALREMGETLTLRVARDGDEAMRYLRQTGEFTDARPPSLIFMDFNLPRYDARELLREIKDDLQLRLIPVAILTTSDSDRDVREAYSLYANCYLRKPADLDSFLRTVRTAVHFWMHVVHPA